MNDFKGWFSAWIIRAASSIVLWMLFGLPSQAQFTASEKSNAAASAPFEWQTASPETQGMSSGRLEALWHELDRQETTGFLVIRNDRIVYERYSNDWNAQKPHGTASLAKALVGGMSLAVALTDGRIGLDDQAAKYIPQWKNDPRKTRITIRQLGSHTSGMEDAESNGAPHDKLTGWKGAFWSQHQPPDDPFTLARDQAHIISDPGTRIHYSNPGIGMLIYAITESLRTAPQKDVRTLLRDRVMHPIGVADQDWSIGYGKTFNVDGLPLVAAWGGGSITPRALARVGRLVLHEGNWQGKQLLSKAAVKQVTQDAGLPGHCGMGWWTNGTGRYAHLPQDAVWGAGAGDQALLVIPSLQLIMVRNGKALEGAPTTAEAMEKKLDVFERFHDPRVKVLFAPLMAAITDRPATASAPYPKSKVIAGLDWAPKETIVRQARDSDNWPMAWGDDDRQYTAYGDGTGFDPKVPEKLSMGIARVEGGPDHFIGVNIRSNTAEHKGNGKAGKKASGMLMVDGVLYMWVRNTGNAQLAWSVDHGQTWIWSDWKFTTSFGYPTFLEFGKNYAGARDDYVYIYSTDSDSAYFPADRLVLARVRKDQIRDRGAYEFCVDPVAKPEPIWTKEIIQRGSVFTHKNKCYRCNVSYNAALKRYLLCQAGAERNANFGFGIFDAPEPWGPWTTVSSVPRWDVEPGESASFPTKWMSTDGLTVHLVFSGGDSFNVRRAVLTPIKETTSNK